MATKIQTKNHTDKKQKQNNTANNKVYYVFIVNAR